MTKIKYYLIKTGGSIYTNSVFSYNNIVLHTYNVCK